MRWSLLVRLLRQMNVPVFQIMGERLLISMHLVKVFSALVVDLIRIITFLVVHPWPLLLLQVSSAAIGPVIPKRVHSR